MGARACEGVGENETQIRSTHHPLYVVKEATATQKLSALCYLHPGIGDGVGQVRWG